MGYRVEKEAERRFALSRAFRGEPLIREEGKNLAPARISCSPAYFPDGLPGLLPAISPLAWHLSLGLLKSIMYKDYSVQR